MKLTSESTFESYTKIQNRFGTCIITYENKCRARNYISGNILMSWKNSHLYLVSPVFNKLDYLLNPVLGDVKFYVLKVISLVQLIWKILQIMFFFSFLVLHDTHYIFKAMKCPAVKKLWSSHCFFKYCFSEPGCHWNQFRKCCAVVKGLTASCWLKFAGRAVRLKLVVWPNRLVGSLWFWWHFHGRIDS